MPDLVGSVLDTAASLGPQKAITVGRRTLTYDELGERVTRTIAGLREAGLAPGDRVVFSIRPGIDSIVLALAIAGAGGAAMFSDPGVGLELFQARVRTAGPRWVAAEPLLYALSHTRIGRRLGVTLPRYAELAPPRHHLRAGPWLPGTPFGARSLRALRRADASNGTLHPDQGLPAVITFTSGTTGSPKGVVHSRASLGAGLSAFADIARIQPGQTLLTDQLMIGIPALIAGAHWQFPAAGLDPAARPGRYLGMLQDADLFYAVPAAMRDLLDLLEREGRRIERTTLVATGAAPVLAPLLRRIDDRFPNARILSVYGMTEILPVAVADGHEKLARTTPGDWAGRLVGDVRARTDDDELVLRGPHQMTGYLGQDDATEVRTGDLARLTEDGVVLMGRRKDMFIRCDTNIYPGLYEPTIAALPGVRDTAMAGIADDIGDDRIVLAVVPDAGYDGPPDAQHPLAREVARALPSLIDAAALPDLVAVVPALPLSGRSRKLDRGELALLLQPLLTATR
ncbi:acyl-CoA synthetase (AMP-forming)/AMP-acid ligase II [Microbacterium resistens]|uniref:Acyl-CoA synthetase (AMP-forming)/AMP-acid ligase II n=1 Tax=Microbacterium resistens TaxID=156977 RepID=A0ABU1SAF5_9MICO|nr:class I adenylate-forming enzyme family protein [Microbacterium resistens]MDR6866585.1 acyl-CoA synthetase (AMP-forming)/AMP-acid ligase II [Microbacterium resistens]